MDNQLIALNLILETLTPTLDFQASELDVQRLLYLSSVIGVNMGYSFSWNTVGVYSKSLIQDYNDLLETISTEQTPYGDNLKPIYLKHLHQCKRLIQLPQTLTFAINQAEWIDLLTTLHYCQTERDLSLEDIKRVLKPTQYHYISAIDIAQLALTQFNLIRTV